VTRYLLNPAHRLVHPADIQHPDLDWWRSMVPALGFAVALVVVQFIPANNWLRNFTPFLFLLTIPFSRLYQRRYRRLQAQYKAHLAATTAQ
jgi:hypothetical protein